MQNIIDGWITDPSVAPRISDQDGQILAFNVSGGTNPFWFPNFTMPDLPASVKNSCWDCVKSAFARQKDILFANAYKNKRTAMRCGLQSYAPRVKKAVIVGKPICEYANAKRGDDELWIGVNWALSDPNDIDVCFFNAVNNDFSVKNTGHCALIANAVSCPRFIDRWRGNKVFYASASSYGYSMSDCTSVGLMYDTGDPTVAALMWLWNNGPLESVKLIDADVSLERKCPGTTEWNRRWICSGHGSNIACLCMATYFLSAAGVAVERKYGSF